MMQYSEIPESDNDQSYIIPSPVGSNFEDFEFNENEGNIFMEDIFLAIKDTDYKTPTKIGKKRKNEKGKTLTEYREDNMAKKIKNIFLKAFIQFLCLIFNYYLKDEDKAKLIPHEIKAKIKKKDLKQLLKKLDYKEMIYEKYSFKVNLEMFDQPIGKIASNNISKKYKLFGKSYNKEIIEQIKKKSNTVINFFLEMTFRDFIDVYLGKKELKDFDELDENFKKEFKYEGVQEYFSTKKFKDFKDEVYRKSFVEMMNNFEKYYKDMEERTGKAKKDSFNNLPKDYINAAPHIK